MQHQRKCASDVFFQTMTGTSSSVGTLFVWFPAAWMPLVVEAIRWKTARWGDRGRHQGAVARTDVSHTRIPDNREFSYKLKRWQVDRRGQSPVLHARANVDWLTLDPEIFACIFPRLYDRWHLARHLPPESLNGMASCIQPAVWL